PGHRLARRPVESGADSGPHAASERRYRPGPIRAVLELHGSGGNAPEYGRSAARAAPEHRLRSELTPPCGPGRHLAPQLGSPAPGLGRSPVPDVSRHPADHSGEVPEPAGEHAFGAMLGYEQTANDQEWTQGYRQNFYNNDVQQLRSGDPAAPRNDGTASAWRMRSGFGRVTYGWRGKYLFEANGRYDGSS